MKYGLLVVEKTRNIGDDVQSYATRRFLPRVDYYIDRDHCDEFVPEKNEYVATIVNGWYLQYTLNWPFSPFIYPMAVSMHFSNKDWFWDTTDRAYHLQGYGLEYLKKIQPIGCRDSHTVKLLEGLGVKTEYTGCMTLTIPKFKNVRKGNYICAVDVSEAVVEKLKKMTKLEVKVITHIVPEDYYRLSWEERMENVEKLLKLYQGARAVISYRLHCALPCLALGTKVVLLNEDYRNDRFGDYVKYMDSCSEEELLNGVVDYDFENMKPHDNSWQKLKKELEDRCKRFIDDCESNPKKYDEKNIDVINYKEYVVNKSNWLKFAVLESYNRYDEIKQNVLPIQKRNKELEEELLYYKKEFDSCAKKLSEKNEEIEKMKNSRIWKMRSIVKKN